MKALVLCVAALVGSVALATEYTWKPDAADPDNILTNPVHFSEAPEDILPTDILKFSAGAEQWTITLPSGCSWTSHICPSFRMAAGGKITFDMPNATWTHADLSSGVYADKSRIDARADAYQQFQFTAPSYTSKGAFRFDNAKFSVSETPDRVFRFDLERGTMDLRAPNGVDLGATIYWPSSKTMLNSQLRFHAGSHAEFPTLLVYAMCPTNEIIVDGGHHRIKYLSIRTEDGNSDVGSVPRTRVTVSGENTELALENFATAADHTYAVNVVSNGVLSFTGKSMSQANGAGRIFVDGGSLMFTNIAYNYATTLAGGDKLFIMTSPDINVTNGTVVSCSATGVDASVDAFFRIGDGTFTLVDSTFDAEHLGLIGSAVLDMTRTHFSVDKKFYIGYNSLSRSVVNLRGGTFGFSASLTVGQSARSSSTLNLLDGVASTGTRITVGYDAAATGTVNIASGNLTLSENLVIGYKGSGTANVYGGTNECHSVLMCNEKTASGMSVVFNQTGGVFTVNSGSVTAFPVAGVTSCSALVSLYGGVLNANSVSGGAGCSAVNPAQGGTASFVADGGKIVASAKTAANLVAGFNSALLGEKGLRVETKTDATIPQNFGNLPEASGRLVLAGSGTKTISGAGNTVSNIVVAEGTAIFASGARAVSHVTVAGGATASFGAMGGTGCLTGLTVGDANGSGLLQFAEGESLVVSGAVDFVDVAVEFDQAYPLGTTNALLVCTEPVSAASLEAWKNAMVRSACAEGTASRFIAETDGEGVTTFKVAVTEPESLYVRAETADLSDSVDRWFADVDTLVAVVSNGYSMALSGQLERGVLNKVGGGRFSMTNPLNLLLGGIFSDGGTFDVVSMAALGWSALGTGDFTLRGGTLAFNDSASSEFPCRLAVDADYAGGASNAVVLKVDRPATVRSLKIDSGAIVKRGTAALTIAPGPNTTTTLSVGDGCASGAAWPASSTQVAVFDADGTSPSEGFTGFSVAEGEVILKGDSTTVFSMPNVSSVGIRATPISVQPVLTVDGATLNFGKDTKRFIVGGSVQAGDAATNAAFNAVGGANVTIGSFVCANGAKAVSQPRVTIDASTVTCNNLNGGYDSGNKAVPLFTVRNGGRLYAKSVSHYGPSDFAVSGGSVFGKNADGDSMPVSLKYYGGNWSFSSGAEFRCASIAFDQPKLSSNVLNLTFDGGKWLTGGNDLVFAGPQYLSITAVGGGLVLPVASGTLRLAKQVAGTGGIVKTGEGVLVVDRQISKVDEVETVQDDPKTIACSGVNRVDGGTLRIAHTDAVVDQAQFAIASTGVLDLAGQTLTRARISGSGTVSGGTLDRATVTVAAGGASAQTMFSGVTFAGRTVFDISTLPQYVSGDMTVVVARYEGAAPALGGFRVVGQSKVGATFSAAAGEIRATLMPAGFLLIVR